MPTYAKDTAVPVSASQEEIERTLMRYGATSFVRGWEGERAMLAFTIHKRQIRMTLVLPKRSDYALTETGKCRTDSSQQAAWEQACRQRWRALALVVKAKLEAVESGISTIEQEFMAHIMLPSGETVSEWLTPQIARAYQTAQMPALLPGGEG